MPGHASAAAPRIVVVGSSNTDLVVCVPKIPAPGETVLGGSLAVVSGGKGANQAVAAARLGGNVTFIARVGEDDFGRRAVAALQEEGIETRFVTVTPGSASGVALIAVVASSGENSIVVAPGANALLTAADVDAAAEAFAVAHAVVLSLEVPLEAVMRAAEIAAEQRIPVVLNPAPARKLPDALLARVSVLTPNEQEAGQILGSSDAAVDGDLNTVAAALLALGVESVVVTLGAAGALIGTADGIEHARPFPVRPVDTVGAGDCFTGALAVEIAAGRSLRNAVTFANAAAALKVTRRGAQGGVPYRVGVLSVLARGMVEITDDNGA